MAYTDTASTAAPNTRAAPGVPLGSRLEIFPSMPLAECNAVGGPAFVARTRGEAASDLMAIICNSGLPPRTDSLNSMRSIDHPALLRLVESGVVSWPIDGMNYYAFVYQRPLSPRFKQSIDEPHTSLSEDAVNHHFVTPMIGALNEFFRTGMVHNAIRPTNIFWRIGAGTSPQLGECLSAPAGLGQPVLFETLERAMTTPMGRGPGMHVDDCYAFGVTLALFVLGQNPMRGMDDRTIIQMKMERGTFGALIGNTRLSGSHIELLRGLLTDDARQRWSGAELEQWLSGRRLTPKNTDAGRRAARHIQFAGQDYWQLRPLAQALANHVSAAATIIENGTLDKWLRRALADDERADTVTATQSTLKESGKTAHYEDQLVGRVSIALDPSAPIRYRGISAMPAGLPNLLVETLLTGGNVQNLSEIISSQFVTFWINSQKEVKPDIVPLGQQFERMRSLIERSSLGYGVERVIYELNPSLPCLSPFLRTQYVLNARALLVALERIAALPNRPREPMDRHIAAFLIVRERRSEGLFSAMSGPDTSPSKGIALLTLFSEMQYRHGPDALPNLAQWLLPLLEVSTQRYISKGMRSKTQNLLRETAQRGNLGALINLIDDPHKIERDQQDFMAARLLYLSTLKEITIIENNLTHRDTVVESEGKPMAVSFSGFLAVLLMMAALLRAVWQNI